MRYFDTFGIVPLIISTTEVFALLVCYVAFVGSCLPAFRGSLTVPSSKGR
jgi:hypothetical protein